MTVIGEKRCIAISVIISIIVMQTVSAQRAPFAGSRPPNGLNQKDKYHATAAVPSTSTDIQNRFGSADAPISNQIPYGQPQKPPVGFVVAPENTYVHLENADNAVLFEDRFGETDTNVISSTPIVATTPPPGHPFDAHGDQQLIEQLSKLPIDKRPFWFINYQAIEAQRNGSTANVAPAQASRGSFFG